MPQGPFSHNLEDCSAGLLKSVYYVPEYISEAVHASLLQQIVSARTRWTQLSGRRLQNLGGSVHEKLGLLQAPIPTWLQPLVDRVGQDTGVYGAGSANHVLLNAYKPGEGILAHQDGPLYFPGVCIVSLQAPAIIRFRRKGSDASADPVLSVACMPRSLLVFKDEAYEDCLHGIDEVTEEVIDASVANASACGLAIGSGLPRGGERFSLTIRRVLKVRKNLLRL
ncbi:hypothetical protein WJX72_004348 [[Myrmecia] bisecta]|uniref:Fe2OG dioxygenase domain-containing protein n=1 Tax=[Myrmecia] bisecta TaxID=41462 RepID=A0AAW1R6E9_9CHLO